MLYFIETLYTYAIMHKHMTDKVTVMIWLSVPSFVQYLSTENDNQWTVSVTVKLTVKFLLICSSVTERLQTKMWLF